ncbi:2-oxoglutarate dehydrogenase complex dihydrolipoyllysine-residue succinyltransferase [Devosia neptuniae]|jgi:2-oxoglutarate dehydrogenase E2 component (dihydrolipoamide succinyltransferase)|uniref:2-oxoglutarate dehydrogenase complex dihydrolipoyllysine-residue succinyltransferase n=1 Tax=Devosia TaxID=46913 RepID=UPI0022B02819|nr:2-oxoglutarate dehydrogenase complex dihydrolipoyllysine-residue succinyltransferase [Devosia neptuniae]MCZ4346720.1 2-oxoglutarate dehydrogenase complex dihydrolipoyllysine-residue succinyltransferase [Devosia neptuniae]|tara:strand:- start:2793 stop:4049 length:1257 start_codon:yes stop_codon:yes gene_type:complete
MSTEIRVPTLGESVTEATIGQWFKQVGDTVAADEPLVELETDKVTIEVPAPAAGVLEAIAANPGDTVEINALLGAIGGAGAAAAPKATAEPIKAEAPPAAAPAAAPAAQATSMAPSPSAQKMAAEKGVDTDDVAGSGKRGQVLKEDVLSAMSKIAAAPAEAKPAEAKPAEAKAPAAAKAPASGVQGDREERVKMTRLRQTIARRLKDAQNTAAMLTTFNEVDMAPVMNLRTQYKELFEKKHGVKLGFMGFFTKAVVHALKEIPAVNAEIDGDELIYKQYANIGVAVGTDKGLVVPVVRDADQMSIADIEKAINGLGKKARDGQLSMADMQGGTFTISNGGVYGSLMSTPILNAPQSGILGMHKIQERPVVVNGEIVIRPMMYLALSYDHRIVDGKEAVTFLVRVKESLESPERLVLDL